MEGGEGGMVSMTCGAIHGIIVSVDDYNCYDNTSHDNSCSGSIIYYNGRHVIVLLLTNTMAGHQTKERCPPQKQRP